MNTTKEELKQYLPNLKASELNFMIDYFKDHEIDLDKIDFYSLGNDTNFEILQGYLFQEYAIELPSPKTDKLSELEPKQYKDVYLNDININKLFDRPKVISITGDVNTGKSMLLYHLLIRAKRQHNFNLYYYGLRLNVYGINSQRIYSVAEMEEVKDAIICVDELSTLFDLENRKSKRMIENTLRLINHNNNILILCGVPENFKKFISGKLDEIIYKKCTIADFINGSSIKNNMLSYKGYELGSELLNIDVDKALYYDGKHYSTIDIPYYQRYDSKKDNMQILQKKEQYQKPKSIIYL